MEENSNSLPFKLEKLSVSHRKLKGTEQDNHQLLEKATEENTDTVFP